MKRIDLTGQRYGRLVVIRYAGAMCWDVMCDCGRSRTVTGGNLRRGLTQSCGCLGAELSSSRAYAREHPHLDLTGRVFGELTALSYAGRGEWNIKCSCGTERTISGKALRSGSTRSCGCKTLTLRAATTSSSPQDRSVDDLTGQRFGQLVVLGRAGSTHKRHRTWNVRCECGAEKRVTTTALHHGLQSCGCLKSRPLPALQGLKNRVIQRYIAQATQRGLIWGLSDAEAERIIACPCHYCAAPPSSKIERPSGRATLYYTGIDRIDNTQGYTPGNVVPCCGTCNRCKSDMTREQFLSHASRVASLHPREVSTCP